MLADRQGRVDSQGPHPGALGATLAEEAAVLAVVAVAIMQALVSPSCKKDWH